MDAKGINQEGLLEKVLNDNGVKLNRLQLELLDIIYCGDSNDLQDCLFITAPESSMNSITVYPVAATLKAYLEFKIL